jgi:hypothetical protein
VRSERGATTQADLFPGAARGVSYILSRVSVVRVIKIGSRLRIALAEEVCDEFDELPVVNRAGLTASMETFADLSAGQTLPPQQYNSEGRHKIAGKEIALFAFKDSHFRLYGGFVTVDRHSTWLGVMLVIKKRNKADPGALQTAASRLREYT